MCRTASKMSVVCETDEGWFADHQRAVMKVYKRCVDQDGYTDLKLKTDMFNIQCPFMMDSHFENWKIQIQDGKTKKRKKRKQEPTEISSAELHEKLSTAHKHLVAAARECGYLKQRSELTTDNNKSARHAANISGPGEKLVEISEMWSKGDNSWCSPVTITASDKLTLFDLFHRKVTFQGDNPCVFQVEGDKYLVPAEAAFVMSEYDQLVSNVDKLKTPGGYDLIVIDPPWTNKSVKRKKSYGSLDEEQLLQLPLSNLAKPGCIIAVWVTNKPCLLDFVRHQLLPAWGVHLVRQWNWVKITVSGELVCDLESPTKKPYETLLLGRVQQQESDSSNKSGGDNSYASSLPKEYLQLSPETVDQSQDNPAEYVKERNSEDNKSTQGGDNSSHFSKAKGGHCEPGSVGESLTIQSLSSGGKKQSHQDEMSSSELPDDKILLSVPCSLHSKKPPLQETLQQFLPPQPQCLELFARNLWTGWVSWGHELLRLSCSEITLKYSQNELHIETESQDNRL